MRILSNPNANGAINSSYSRCILASPLQFSAKPTFLYECMALTRINFASRKCHSHSNTVSISQSSSFCRAANSIFRSKSFAALHDNPCKILTHRFCRRASPQSSTFVRDSLGAERQDNELLSKHSSVKRIHFAKKGRQRQFLQSPNHMAIIKYPSSHCRCCFLMYLPWSRTAFVKANYEANRPQKHRLHH